MNTEILRLKQVNKIYNNQTHALNDLSVTINKGEFIVVIGPSGAGKSTFIRCINRMIDPSSGEIIFNNKHIENLKGKELRKCRSQIGMIFQNYNLVSRTNVIKNVLHGRLGHMKFIHSILGHYTKEDIKEAYNLLKQVGLEDQIYKRADELSGGQMQRVGICRAVIQNPKLLLADEPIASLDPSSATLIMDTLNTIVKERELTCIVNLHQIDFAKKYATRIIGIKEGQIVFDGKPELLDEKMISYIYKGREDQMYLPEDKLIPQKQAIDKPKFQLKEGIL